MSLVYFLSQDGKTRVTMDTESRVEVSLPSTVSKSSVMSGTSISDDVIEGNAVISVSGKVTYAKLVSQEGNLNPIQYQEAIQEARRNRKRFTLYVKDNGLPLLQDYKDCVISDCNFTVDIYSDTITSNITFEQVFVSNSARKAFLAPKRAESVKPSTSDTDDSGQSSKSQIDDNDSRTMFRAFYEEGADIVSGISGG